MNKERNIIILICALIAGVLGYKFSDIDGGTVHDMSAEEKRLSAALAKDSKYITPQKKKFKGAPQEESDFPQEIKSEILKGEKILHFKSKEEMEAFLRRARENGLKIIKKIDGLNLVKVRFSIPKDSNDFLARFHEISIISDNDPVSIPDPLLQAGSVGFRSNPLKFLGIGDNTGWGTGVKVAVIDTGVVSHPALKGKVEHIDLINDGLPFTSFHGTAVASLIVGDSNIVKGISPGADILDIRALNSDGSGDAFTVAEAIYLAVENGSKVINLSLGSPSDNAALRDAVLYAQRHGVILVAAVGNEGVGQVSYPANYPGVIGVSSNDANEGYLTFSNRGPQVDLSAPGIELAAAGVDNDAILFTGTSASSPLVAGTVARMLEQYPDMPYSEVVSNLQNTANEAGPPGQDVFFGDGILNVGRLEANTTQKVIDTAASG
ncbi:MAG: S8 family serine peptidase, partial [Lentisphaeraceae bacterium]|nr:S8 family serine peptidase [Lentisphaeraceae bacterium]